VTRAVLLDIEGTTTPIAFVYQTLFPYARARAAQWLRDRAADPAVARIVTALEQERQQDPDAPPQGPAAEYVAWLMDQDRKSTPLKELQGLIWEEGYRRGELIGELFPDVAPAFHAWRARGVGIGIFSSGSVLAQRLLFEHSSAGDLSGVLQWHFDTTTGAKRSRDSYARIAGTIGLPPADVLFVSDVLEELDAATAAGMRTALAARPGNAPLARDHGHRVVATFDDLI
jgi:enolase-phosphatase E1